jgi:FtsP/CotA-like multicopper oxidase with cupredoxin domain
MLPGEKQLWRVANASADTQLDLQVVFDGTPQPLKVVALDGVPTGSQDGTRRGMALEATDILVPTASRAEFIVSAPPSGVTNAQLITLNINTGPDGDNDPTRPLANIQVLDSDADHHSARDNDENISASVGPAWPQRFEGLDTSSVTARRKLYFSEVISDPNNPLSPTNFYITVDGATPTLFSPDNPPAIVTTQGSVEDWTVENRSEEVHEFHIHQIHYLVLSQNNFGVNGAQPDATIQGQFLDMINVPAWDGNPDHPYPSVTVRMDFRGKDIGDFVYHCHILGHEDAGMMAIIRVMPANRASAGSSVQARLEGSANSKRVYDRPAVGAEK